MENQQINSILFVKSFDRKYFSQTVFLLHQQPAVNLNKMKGFHLGIIHYIFSTLHKLHKIQLHDWLMSQVQSNTPRPEEHTSELQSRFDIVCRLLLEKNKLHYSN